MQATNPYAVSAATPAAIASADARATFLQKTYALLLTGVFGFAFTLWAAANVPAVNGLAVKLWSGGPLLVIGLMLGSGWLVRTMAERSPINLVLYFAYVFFFGLLFAPLVLFAAQAHPSVLTQASLMTAITFAGLTGYVFASRKDFSFLGGALSIGAFAMLGLIIAGLVFGFSLGLWFSVAGVILFAGYVLYNTSQILHHYPTHAHVSAAIVLFVDIVMLFQYLLMLLLRSRD